MIRDLPEGATFLDARYSGIEWINRTERAWSIGDSRSTRAPARSCTRWRASTRTAGAPPPACGGTSARPPRGAATAPTCPDAAWPWLATGGGRGRTLVLARLALPLGPRGGPHARPRPQLGGHHVRLGLGDGLPGAQHPAQVRERRPRPLRRLSDATSAPTTGLMIRWGYTPGRGPRARWIAIVREGYARGVVYPLESDPRWAEYDWGADPGGLAAHHAGRAARDPRALRPGQLAAGRAASTTLQVRFSLAYLYHRFGIQAAQQYVGGQFQTNALAGDGQTPTRLGAGRQAAARRSSCCSPRWRPRTWTCPTRASRRSSRAFRHSPTRERFRLRGGRGLQPARARRASLAGLVVRPLLEPERAARLTLASGTGALTLDACCGAWSRRPGGAAPDPLARHAALRRVAQRVGPRRPARPRGPPRPLPKCARWRWRVWCGCARTSACARERIRRRTRTCAWPSATSRSSSTIPKRAGPARSPAGAAGRPIG